MKVFGVPLGLSAIFWILVGLVRVLHEKVLFRKKRKPRRTLKSSDIAAILPAHNEEIVVRQCIQALKQSLKPEQIFVVSDGSKDKTYRRARMEKCHVSCLNPGRGKAKALLYLLKRYKLFERYKLIFIIDADTQVDRAFVPQSLSVLRDSEIAVVFASPRIRWPAHIFPRRKLYFIAYRERLNRLLQMIYIYGQTWKYTNTNYVVPGFCTIYRSAVLKELEIDTPGLLIEDFNLAFQLHRRKLGKIGHSFGLIGWDQHPDNLKDYWKQLRRWNIGFFQTVRRNGIWPSFFWLALGTFTLEVFLNAIFTFFLPFLLLFLLIKPELGSVSLATIYSNLYRQYGLYQYLTVKDILFYLFVIDYGATLFIGLLYKKPQFAIYGLFFFFMHYVTALILLSSLIPGLLSSSHGQWVSPRRRAE